MWSSCAFGCIAPIPWYRNTGMRLSAAPPIVLNARFFPMKLAPPRTHATLCIACDPLMRRPGIIVRRRFLLAHAPPHLRHTVRQLLMVHGHALGLVQRHQCSLQEALNAWRHGRVSMACKTSDREHGLSTQTAPCCRQRQRSGPPAASRAHLVLLFQGQCEPVDDRAQDL